MTDALLVLTTALAIGVKAAATGAFVLVMAVLIDRAPPRIAAASIGFPVVIGPGFFLVALQQPTDFLVAAAAAAVSALIGTLVFMVVIGRWFRALPALPLVASGIGAWALVAFGLAEAGLSLGLALLAFAAAFLVSLRILPPATQHPEASPRPKLRRRPPYDRAIQAGLFVAVVTYAADHLGERLTAVLLAMPVAMIFLTLTLKARVDASAGARVYQWGRMGMLPLLTFVLTIYLTATKLGNVPSVLLAFAVSMSFAVAMVTVQEAFARRADGETLAGGPR